MARSDFTIVDFNTVFTPNAPTATETFTVEGNPRGPSYLLIQAHDVEAGGHSIAINGQVLPELGLAPNLPPAEDKRWRTWTQQIPANVLHAGDNRITITQSGQDSFRVAGVVIHWREAG